MPVSDLVSLITNPGNERLNVEYKAWLDINDSENRAKLARHFAAIANYDGGYLIFGVDDKTKAPLAPAPYVARDVITQDAISGIVQRYLAPTFQCEVKFVPHKGTDYPIVIVPGHGSSPIIAVRDGPHNNGRPTGISQGNIYYRDVGPASRPIIKQEQWGELLERCLSRRADILASIMRRAITVSASPSTDADELLRAVCDATCADFARQAQQDLGLQDTSAAVLRASADNYVTIGYSILGNDGNPIRIENPTILNERVSVSLHRYADYGWTYFYPVRAPERAPQYRTATIAGRERTYAEGMRIATSAVYFGAVEYWRIFEDGFWCLSQSYREDYNTAEHNFDPRVLATLQCMMKFHGMLAHARLTGEELAEPNLVIMRMDWRGLQGRRLVYDHRPGGISRLASEKPVLTDRYVKTLVFRWPEIRDHYFAALKRLCAAFFVIFGNPEFNPEEVVTREWVEHEFAKLRSGPVRLF